MAPTLPTDIDGVLAQLDNVIDWSIEQKSPAGYFTAIYRGVTATIKEKIAEEYFDDNPRMERFDVVFASRYLDAFYTWRDGGQPTAAWSTALDASANHKLSILQQLLPAVNAHMDLDLGVAASEIAAPGDIQGLKGDFDKINKVLSALVDHDRLMVESVSPGLKWLDRFGKLSDLFVEADIELRRNESWHFAVSLADADAEQRPALIDARDKHTVKEDHEWLHPPWLLRIIVTLLIQRQEPKNPAVTIEKLRKG